MKEQFTQAVNLDKELLAAKADNLNHEQIKQLRQRVKGLYEDTDDEVARYKIILAVVEHQFRPSLSLLKRALFKDLSALIRHEAAFGLAEMEGIKVQPLLIRALQDTHGIVRHEAAEMLGWCGDREALKPLKPLLEDPDINWGVAETARIAIDMISYRLPLEAST